VNEDYALARLRVAGLVPGQRTTVVDSSMPAGAVVATIPGAGTVVDPGSPIAYVVSSGAAPRPLPTAGPTALPTGVPREAGDATEAWLLAQIKRLGYPKCRTESVRRGSPNRREGAIAQVFCDPKRDDHYLVAFALFETRADLDDYMRSMRRADWSDIAICGPTWGFERGPDKQGDIACGRTDSSTLVVWSDRPRRLLGWVYSNDLSPARLYDRWLSGFPLPDY
jgi:hypothetical protein